MGRAPCCDKANVKKGPWSPEEDAKLKEYMDKSGTGGNWIALPEKAGLRRCGKSCRLRWLNYLRPNLKHGDFTDDEDRIICSLFASLGSRWSIIAAQLPGRTDNDIKNYWNTKLKKKLKEMIHNSTQKSTQKSTLYPSISVLEPSTITLSPYSAPSPSITSVYKCSENNYYTPIRSLSGYESPSILSTLLNPNCSSNLQEGYLGSVKSFQVQDSFMRFGGEASSSSSDGSSTNQTSYNKEGAENELQKYLYKGLDENQKIKYADDLKPNRCYGENPLDYGLEEIKQLISTNLCNNLFFDEIKAEEKVAYYT